VNSSTYLVLVLLLLFTEAVLLLIHLQTQSEQTRQTRSFLDMENDRVKKKIEALQVNIQDMKRELESKQFEIGSMRSS
jgi:hypothetical protein